MEVSSKKNLQNGIKSILFPIFYTLLLFFLALLIYFYANGYRFDILKNEVTQTGVITVESDPTGTDIYVNGEILGRSPKSSSIEIGNYHITASKDGYNTWEKDIKILEGKSTPIYPWLIKNNLTPEILWTSTGEFVKMWSNKDRNHMVFLTQETDHYSLWEYSMSPALWDFSSNPSEVLTTDSPDIDISVSPSGELALLAIGADATRQYYILDLQKMNNLANLKSLSIDSTKGYSVSWAEDNNFLILESSNEIISYDIRLSKTYPLLTKSSSQKYIWNTDNRSFFYIVEPITESPEQAYAYRLKQINMDGTNAQYIMDTFYFNKSDQYINQYRQNGYEYTEFASAPESTLSSGELTSIVVNQDAKGMYLCTTMASYWYNIKTQKFMMISPYPSTLVEFSVEDKLMFQNATQIGVFTYDKTEGDPTNAIGSKALVGIADISKISKLAWVPYSTYLTYLEDGKIYIADKDGENKTGIVEAPNLVNFAIKDSRDILTTFETNSDSKLVISRITIH